MPVHVTIPPFAAFTEDEAHVLERLCTSPSGTLDHVRSLTTVIPNLLRAVQTLEALAASQGRVITALNSRVTLLEQTSRILGPPGPTGMTGATGEPGPAGAVVAPPPPAAPAAPVPAPAAPVAPPAAPAGSVPPAPVAAAGPVAPATVAAAVPAAAGAGATPTVDALRAALITYSQRFGMEYARRIIAQHGGANAVSAVAPERRQAVIDAITAASTVAQAPAAG